MLSVNVLLHPGTDLDFLYGSYSCPCQLTELHHNDSDID